MARHSYDFYNTTRVPWTDNILVPEVGWGDGGNYKTWDLKTQSVSLGVAPSLSMMLAPEVSERLFCSVQGNLLPAFIFPYIRMEKVLKACIPSFQ